MRTHLGLIAAFVVAALAVENTNASHGRLNDYLIDKVDSNEVGPNMEAAINWLNEKEAMQQSIFSISPVAGLKKFVSLQQVMDDTKCDKTAYVILRANEQAVNLHKLVEGGRIIRRVDKVMHQIFVEHSKKCQELYPKIFRSKKERFNQTDFKRIAILGDYLIQRTSSSLTPFASTGLYNFFVKPVLTIKNFAGGNKLKIALKKAAKEDPDAVCVGQIPDERSGKMKANKDKIKELVSEYQIKPCQRYVAEFGDDLFIPAEYDARAYHKIDREQDYYLGWSYYKICQVLIDNKATASNEVIKSVLIQD